MRLSSRGLRRVELAQQILLTPRIKPINILRLQRGRIRVGHDSHGLQIRHFAFLALGGLLLWRGANNGSNRRAQHATKAA